MTFFSPSAARRSLRGGIPTVVVALAALSLLPEPGEAQYFGRNKVQYDSFGFQVMKTPHFDIHYYPEAAVAIEDAARMSERWYERLARTFQHEFERPKPVILYADHPDFQQTNTLAGFISEGTGGVTESLKNRVIMPLAGTYHDTDHVLGHELVHAFQYNIAQSRSGGGLRGMAQLPLWVVEGMAEYLSVGREDPLTAMWLRDALLRDDVPTLEQMTRERRFFPYRFGQAFWTYVGGTYGDEAVTELYRRSLRVGWENAIVSVLGKTQDTVSMEWHRAIESEYRPLMAGRSAPGEVGALLLAPSTGAGSQNVAPSVSPDGRYVAFISEKDLFSVDLYMADARTGRIVRKLSSAATDAHMDALRFLDSSGSWSPDGTSFAFVAIAEGDNQLVIVDVDNSDVERRIEVEDANIGAISNPAWSPDGRSIVFSGQSGGISDLFMVDLETDRVSRLTHDKHGDMQPAFSPDGSTLAFVTDRGGETDFGDLVFSRPRIALLDMETRDVRTLELFGNVKHLNPQFTPDGQSLYFISDQDGFSDVYRVNLSTGDIYRVTNIATAVSGITSGSPAMSVASRTGTLVFSVFDEFEFHIYSLSSQEAGAAQELARAGAGVPQGRLIPPSEPLVRSRVAQYLGDPITGLPPAGAYLSEEASAYDSGLKLDYVGQPMIGIGAGDIYGNNLQGGAAAFFSDMLGDRSLGVAVQAQGTFKDLGGQFLYQNMKRRWNWGVSGGRIPYQLLWASFERTPNDTFAYRALRERIFIDSATGMLAYPFSTTQRIESRFGLTRYSFDLEEEHLYFDPLGRLADRRVRELDNTQPPINMVHASLALVGDNSYSAFTSPVRGSRYRFEVENTVGTADFRTLTADYRRYFNPVRELTVAFRGLHYGRYGITEEEAKVGLRQIFLGYENLIRGYARESFDFSACVRNEICTESDRYQQLFGQRVQVFNFEMRVPLTGVSQFGLLDLPFLPIELVTFADVGLAWDDFGDVDLRFDRTTRDRVPVFSTGVSARVNLLGFMILESYYAYPFQRPDKGWHWGFTLAPGW